jgi:hypothetical protein
MNDDLERNLRDSLDRHAAGAATSGGSLDDVYHRVDRQHARRRSVAVIGSIAVVAAGAIGFAAMAGGGSDSAADFAAPASDVATSTTTIAPSTNVYACTNHLGAQDVPAYGPREIYGDCVVVTWDIGLVTTTIAAVECVPTTMLTTTTPTAFGCGSVMEGTAPPTTNGPSAPNCLSGAVVPTTAPAGAGIADGEQQYIVVAGDSLLSIAASYGVAPDIIANYNGWTDCLDHPIFVGDIILIPPGALIPAG